MEESARFKQDGSVYIRQQNKLTALDGQTGQPIWEYDAGDIVKTPAIDDSGAIIFKSAKQVFTQSTPMMEN